MSLALAASAGADSGPSSYLEAQALLRSSKWAEAAIALRKALEEQPGFLPAQLQFGSALIRLERRAEAMNAMSRWAAGESGSRRDLLIERIRVYSTIFLTSEGLQSYLDAVNLLSDGKVTEAKTKFQQISEKERDNAQLLLRLGQCDVLEGDYDTASEHLRSANQINSYEPQIHLWLGRALMKRGEITEAVAELKTARSGLPSSGQSAAWLAEAYFLTGQKPPAIDLLEKDVQDYPAHLQSLVVLARLRFDLGPYNAGMLAESKKDLQLALSRLHDSYQEKRAEPDDGMVLETFHKGDLEKEIQTLMESVETRIDRLSSG